VWNLLVDAEIRDLGRADAPADGVNDFLLHVDGYLCELGALIRGGLHRCGRPKDAELDLLAITRLPNGGVRHRATAARKAGVDWRRRRRRR
jgi:cobalamin biosynthesis Mg chelatase CobN